MAPPIGTQPPPLASHRCQLYANAGAPFQMPVVVVTGNPAVKPPASSGRPVAKGASDPIISP